MVSGDRFDLQANYPGGLASRDGGLFFIVFLFLVVGRRFRVLFFLLFSHRLLFFHGLLFFYRLLSRCGLRVKHDAAFRGFVMRVVLAIVRLDSHLVPTIRVGVGLNVPVATDLLDAENLQMVQMGRISHRLHGRIEPDVVTSVEGANEIAVFAEHHFRDGQAEVGPVDTLSVVRVHLDEDVRRVVGQRKRIVFVEIDTGNVAVPLDSLSEEPLVESTLRAAWVLVESTVAASSQVLGPREARDDNYIDRQDEVRKGRESRHSAEETYSFCEGGRPRPE